MLNAKKCIHFHNTREKNENPLVAKYIIYVYLNVTISSTTIASYNLDMFFKSRNIIKNKMLVERVETKVILIFSIY